MIDFRKLQTLAALAGMLACGPVFADVKGPVLTTFRSAPTLDVSEGAMPFEIEVTVTDNSSGVQSCRFDAYGPSGQSMSAYVYPGFPTASFSGKGGFSSINWLLAPGTWKFITGYCYDAAGNYAYISETDLDALGNTTFTVISEGYDHKMPKLRSGKIHTQSEKVSLSEHPNGTTDKDPYVGVQFDVTDVGDTTLAGVASVTAYFCKLANRSKCLYLYGYLPAAGVVNATISATTQVSVARGNDPGNYELQRVWVYDHAGNWASYAGKPFGGATDFSTMFPSTVIKLTP